MNRLRNLNRRVLFALIAGLLILQAGLVWAGAQALRREPSIVAAPTPAAGRPRPTATPVPGRATPRPVETPVVQPVVRQPGTLVAGGDLAGVAKMFDAEEAMGFVEALCAPEFGGRQSGTEGSRLAGQYIADRMQEYGLQPAGTDGYFQPFTVPFAEITGVPTFAFTTTAGVVYDDFVYRKDFAFWWGGYAGAGEADGRVVWLNECRADDFRGVDVAGKIAFCKYSTDDGVFRQVLQHGATGLILLTEQPGRVDRIRTYRQVNYLPESLPVLVVLPQVAESLLTGSGYTVQDLSILYRSVPLDVSAHFEIFLDEPGEAEARNVLGVLPGADPALRDQVLILGGHYDHIGMDANGDHYPGANDDVSGVAVLLEIARSWQAAGFVPDMTVVFAAWDSEEQGLFGAIHYVRNPPYPLASTIGMIQLDMVGLASDGVMSLDGYDNAVGRQLQSSADMLGIPTAKVSFQGGSDHMPFVQSNVTAALLIWDDGNVPYYHTPADTPATLQPERLRQAGAMTSHAAMALTAVEPHLRALLDAQAQAIAAGDLDAYAATLDSEDAALLQAGRDWLATRPLESLQGYTITVGSIAVGGESARAEISASVVGSDGRKSALASWPARMVRRGANWLTARPVAETVAATRVNAEFVQAEDGNADWVRSLEEAYVQQRTLLGFGETPPFTATIYPDQRTMDWLAGPGTGTGSPLPGIHIARSAPLTTTALNLVLGSAGLPSGQGDWLRVGLNEWLKTEGDAEARQEQVILMTPGLSGRVTPQSILTTTGIFGAGQFQTALSLVDFFMQTYGSDGLRGLCAAWAKTGTQEGAFAALGTTPDAFVEAWDAAVLQPIVDARAEIDVVILRREQAVRSGDKVAFLATVNPDDAVFLVEEGHWFDDLAIHPVETYDLEATVLAVDDRGALARLSMTAKLTEAAGPANVSYVARFLRTGDGWVLAGPEWKTIQGEHFLVKYVDKPEAMARAAVDAAEKAYAQVTADLNYTPASLTEIKLYDDSPAMHASILLSLPSWANGWYEPGEAIKLSPNMLPTETATRVWDAAAREWRITEQPAGDYQGPLAAVIAHELAHRVVFELGVDTDWIHEGVAVFESLRTVPDRIAWARAHYVPLVREALRTQTLPDSANMPTWDQVPDERATLFYGQSWMLVDGFARQFGMEGLNRLIRGMGQGQSFLDAFAAVAQMPFAEWRPVWEEAARLGGVPAEYLRAAQAFSADRATETIALLASPEYAGRLAGSAGAEAAAKWIAAEMNEIGLQPGASDGTFFQAVPVFCAELSAVPVLSFSNTATGTVVPLIYGETWREMAGGAAGGGDVESEIVWIPKDFPDDVNLGGRIALKNQVADPSAEAEEALAHGAGGLILVVKSINLNVRERTAPSIRFAGQTIPVAQVADDTWRGIIKMAGLTTYEAINAPPALVTPLKARLSVEYQVKDGANALTVIGVLPGRNPELRPLFIGAHYDGVGALPDGTLYPGANKNASGVAVMLEVARLLRDNRFEPSRPIYFVAWGAEEGGLVSSTFYAEQPVVPVGQIMGLLELDTVGAARSFYLNLEGQTGGLEGELLYSLELAADLLERRVSATPYKGDNTHATFRDRGAPSVLLFWPSPDAIHTPGDAIELIEPYKVATTGEVVALSVMMAAR